MKQVQRLRISFAKYSDAKLDVVTAHILKCMKDNPDFPTPIPTLAELGVALENYRTALRNAQSRASLSVALKNEARRVLIDLLKELGLYIMSVSKGNLVVLSGCGYPLSKVPGPRTISPPGPVLLKIGDSSGKMEASVKPEKPSPTYLFQVTNVDPGGEAEPVWNSFGSTVNKFTFSGLQPRTQYWFRAASIGSRGQQIFGPSSSGYPV